MSISGGSSDETIQFIQNPDEGLDLTSGWLGYFPRPRPEAFLTNLFILQANKSYLIKLDGTQPVTWNVTGVLEPDCLYCHRAQRTIMNPGPGQYMNMNWIWRAASLRGRESLKDAAGNPVKHEWRTLDLSGIQRGGPEDIRLKLQAPEGTSVEGIGIDTVPVPAPEDIPHIEELRL